MSRHGWRWYLTETENPNSLSSRRRDQRDRRFLCPLLDLMSVRRGRPIRILDVGGRAAYWLRGGLLDDPRLGEVTITNFEEDLAQPPHAKLSYAQGIDARRLPYPDGAFDICFSNSVIEHVGDRADQARMVAELMRVGTAVLIQTPNKWFPLEPHFLGVPYFQLLPLSARAALLWSLPLAQAGRIRPLEEARTVADEVKLLGAGDLAAMTPPPNGGRVTIARERVLGLPKSLVLVSRP